MALFAAEAVLAQTSSEAVQLDDLDHEEQVLAWAARQGLDAGRFLAVYKSTEVQAPTADGRQRPDNAP